MLRRVNVTVMHKDDSDITYYADEDGNVATSTLKFGQVGDQGISTGVVKHDFCHGLAILVGPQIIENFPLRSPNAHASEMVASSIGGALFGWDIGYYGMVKSHRRNLLQDYLYQTAQQVLMCYLEQFPSLVEGGREQIEAMAKQYIAQENEDWSKIIRIDISAKISNCDFKKYIGTLMELPTTQAVAALKLSDWNPLYRKTVAAMLPYLDTFVTHVLAKEHHVWRKYGSVITEIANHHRRSGGHVRFS